MEPYTGKTKAFPHLSIRGALVLAVVIALVPCWLIVFSTGARYSRHLEKQATQDVLQQATAIAEIQFRITDSTRQLLATIATSPSLWNAEYDHMEEILRGIHAVNKDYLNLTVSDAQGMVRASSLLQRGTDLSGRPHIQMALNTRRFCAGGYIIGLVGSTPSFAYAYPVLDNEGKPFAVVSALYDISSYTKLFASFSLDRDSFLGIVDRNGVRLYFYPSLDINPIGQAVTEDFWQKIKQGSDTGTFIDTGSDGVERFFGYKKLWLDGDTRPYSTVLYGTPRNTVTSLPRSITQRNIRLLAASALLSLVLSIILSQLLFGRRLSRITSMVSNIQKGDLDSRVGLSSDNSDLGRIAQALDSMAEALQLRDNERVDEEKRLKRLLEEKDVLIKEIHHRVKNNLQMILSLIRLQEENNPVQDTASFESLKSRIASMAVVHEMLYSSSSLLDINLGDYCYRLVELLKNSYAVDKSVTVTCHCDTVYCTIEKAIPFGLLLNELVTNAFKYAAKDANDKAISVSLRAENGIAHVEVFDNGPGLPEGFSLSSSKGLGFQLVQALVGQLDGELSWKNETGVRFIVNFPLRS